MFAGTNTALITPFSKDGLIDKDALRRLVRFQEDNGVDALISCGSTGEFSMLDCNEHFNVISTVIDETKKAKVIAGVESNCTQEAIILSKKAEDLGVDGILLVSPYYVKPTQEGIFKHYKAVQEAINCPIVLYNIPERTGSNIAADTVIKLAELPGIVGIKESSCNISQIQDIIYNRPKGFAVLSGNDSMTLALICIGADGVISVASNCCPGLVSEMVHNARHNKFEIAKSIHNKLLPLFKALFCESNSIPIKYVMSIMGYGDESPRLPLTKLSSKKKSMLNLILENLGIQIQL